MTFRDMTFCKGDGCTKFATCPRAFNEKQSEAAKRWWGNDSAPVCFFANPKELDCYESVLPNAKDQQSASLHRMVRLRGFTLGSIQLMLAILIFLLVLVQVIFF